MNAVKPDPADDIESILAAARAQTFEIPIILLPELVVAARKAFNVFWKGRPPATSDDRLALERLRDLSGFAERTAPLFALPGARQTRIAMHANLMEAIVGKYPHLAAEAERLQRVYVERNSPAPRRRP